MRVIFFGTPSIAASVLKFLHSHQVNIVAVVSKPDKPQGRSQVLIPTPVKEAALQLGLLLLQPERASTLEFARTLEKLNPDLFIVVAYGEIVKQFILDIPKLACINMHASLLPLYRGAAPMQRALIDGERETGVTIIHMTQKMDAGNILHQGKIPIPLTMNLEELKESVVSLGSSLLLEVHEAFKKEVSKGIPQEETKATFAPKIDLTECKLDFSKPMLTLHNLIRGVSPYPGASFRARIRNKVEMIKVYRSFPFPGKRGEPGTITILPKNRLLIACRDGYLEILELQTSGKKRLKAEAWIVGMPKEGIEIIRESF